MCDTCEACNPTGAHQESNHSHPHSHSHSHEHPLFHHLHAHEDTHGGDLSGVDLNIGLLDENEDIASLNRALLERAGVRCINLMSSPGSGKTTLLEHTLRELEGEA